MEKSGPSRIGAINRKRIDEPNFPDHEHSSMNPGRYNKNRDGAGDSMVSLPEKPRKCVIKEEKGDGDEDEDMSCSPIIPVQYSKLKVSAFLL